MLIAVMRCFIHFKIKFKLNIMNTKEKARELVDKMSNRIILDGLYDAKSCAKVSVNETIQVLKNLDEKWHSSEDNVLTSMFSYEVEYFEDVLEEIDNL